MVSRIWMSQSLERPRTMTSLLSGYSWPAEGPDWQTNFPMMVCRSGSPRDNLRTPGSDKGKDPAIPPPAARCTFAAQAEHEHDRRCAALGSAVLEGRMA